MTKLLEQAFSEAARLPTKVQNAIAKRLLAELADERAWDDSFARSQDLLSKMADEARSDLRAGRTQELDPDRL